MYKVQCPAVQTKNMLLSLQGLATLRRKSLSPKHYDLCEMEVSLCEMEANPKSQN